MYKCEKCQDSGFYSEGLGVHVKILACPCKSQKENNVNDTETTEEWLARMIPNPRYLENFDVAKWRICAQNMSPQSVYHYLNSMLHILEQIGEGQLPLNSHYFVSQSTGGKKYFIYTFMRKAKEQGFNPSPLMELWQITDDLKTEKTLRKQLFDYDVLLITASGQMLRGELQTLRLLLQGCELRGIPLIVISSFTQKYVNAVTQFFKMFVDVSNASPYAYSELIYHSLEGDYEA